MWASSIFLLCTPYCFLLCALPQCFCSLFIFKHAFLKQSWVEKQCQWTVSLFPRVLHTVSDSVFILISRFRKQSEKHCQWTVSLFHCTSHCFWFCFYFNQAVLETVWETVWVSSVIFNHPHTTINIVINRKALKLLLSFFKTWFFSQSWIQNPERAIHNFHFWIWDHR